jgi:AsmA protein
MRRIIRITAIVVGVLAAIAITLVMLLPAEVFRGPIEQAGSAATGRALNVRGPLRFTLYPELGISVSDVTLANVSGAQDPDMVSIGRLIVGVRLFPLLSKRLEITRLTLEEPVIHAEVGPDGTGNWVFPAAETAAPQAQAPAGEPSMANFSLSNLRIESGTFTYFDARTGKREQFDDVDVAIDTTSLDEPFAVAGAATYKGQRLEIAGKLGNLGAVMRQVETPASVSVVSDVVKVALDGAVGGQTTASGKLRLEMPSLRQFASWLDVSLPSAKGLGAMTLDATVTVQPQTFSASGITLTLDGMNVAGDFRVMTGGSKPEIAGKLSVDRLDANSYLSTEDASAGPAGADTGWSEEPISFEMLKAIDADLALNVGQLLVRNLEVQKAQMAVALKNGVLRSNLESIVLYQGTGKASLVVDASRDVPTFTNALRVTGLQVEPFLAAFLGVDRVVGSGNVSFDVTAQGTNPKAIIGTLGGKGDIIFRDGMIKGVDLAAVARTIQSALTASSVGERASTDFAELGGTFTIARGVMTNTDFRLLNPFVRMTGNGMVNLAGQSMDFHIEPRLVASAQGQGSQAALAGLGIPFRVSGPWGNLSYGPDMQNVGKALTGTLLDTLTKSGKDSPLGGQQKSGVGDVLKGLFGK